MSNLERSEGWEPISVLVIISRYTEVCNCFIPKRRLRRKNQKSGFNSFNPYAITDPMTGMVPGSNVGIKLEESCAPRRGARRRGMPRRRGRRRFNSPCQ
ncbi:uncharacterized protein LOC117171936 isoform X4 [Belonocnema kinseyi]|uniref:uncharacterized protein LOC117171936 isoform X4 n=1 Tax=Belonocnema kinseyi TaxID=2817044 RepID=UPI00143DBB5B|nr:uncharacterized protein LOC117171936 isoform X4 [Belonocnema kinseyi]